MEGLYHQARGERDARGRTTADKALALNLDGSFYGTLAEIGAGQEVADWLFRVGGSSGTVAKSMSAYDMVMSDAIYGKTERYVSRERLGHMLDHEWAILEERLAPVRGETTRFFVFASTVRARGYRDTGECHGWMGVRFQPHPGAAPHEVILHIRLLDEEAGDQREVAGVVGINLLHALWEARLDPEALASQLLDGINRRRIEVDFLRFEGSGFSGIDNRMSALLLVELGLAEAAMFTRDGEIVQVADKLYRKPVVLLRGDFSPPTVVHLDMLERAGEAMRQRLGSDVRELVELSMHNLFQSSGRVDRGDFISRAEMLQALGKDVMVTRFSEFHRLAHYLRQLCRGEVGLVVGLGLLEQLFDEKWYGDLEGGVLEAFGRLCRRGVFLYAYPVATDDGGVRTLEQAHVSDEFSSLFLFLLRRGLIRGLESHVPRALPFTPQDVRQMILAGDPRWHDLVPAQLGAALMATRAEGGAAFRQEKDS